MSGTNPFRRKNIEQEPRHLDDEILRNLAGGRVPAIDTDVRKPSKKTVRIISPHSAGSDNDTHIPDVLFSPPPRVRKPVETRWDTADSSEDSPSSNDPFNIEDDDGGGTTEDDDLRRNTTENAGSRHNGVLERQKAPPNPFNRTAPLGLSANAENQRANKPAPQSKTKPQYNVDEFKNLLLTGRKSTLETPAPATPPVSFHALQGPSDTSSNTDASSISRHSIFEPPPEARQETPRSSHELSSSDEERQQLVQAALASKGRKPATPRSHHGKPMAENIPQRELYQEPLSPVAKAKVSDSYFGRSPPNSPRTPTDLNKPLPAPPMSEPSELSLPDPLQTPAQPQFDQASTPSSRRREPPPPPSARRQGMARAKTFLGNMGTSQRPLDGNPSESPQPSFSNPGKSSLPQDSNTKPPPPPPRLLAPVRGISASSTTSGISMVPTLSSSTFSDDCSAPKARPPVPPIRNRSSSSVKRQSTLHAQIGSPGVPPAPPPRRRGSSQSSYSLTGLSGDYQSSFVGRQRADSGASSVQSKDVIADLSALQKEVDALRGKFGT